MKEAEAMWLLANMQPATAAEIAEVGDANLNTVRTVLHNLRGYGFVHCRKRVNEKQGNNPNEYAIRVMEDGGDE